MGTVAFIIKILLVLHDDFAVKRRVDAEIQRVRAKMYRVRAETHQVRTKTPRVDAKLYFSLHLATIPDSLSLIILLPQQPIISQIHKSSVPHRMLAPSSFVLHSDLFHDAPRPRIISECTSEHFV